MFFGCPPTNPYGWHFLPDPNFHFLIVLGTFPAPPNTQSPYDRHPSRTGIQTDGSDSADIVRLPAILRIERTAFASTFTDYLSTGIVMSTKRIGHTDIVRTVYSLRSHKLNI